MGYSVVEVITLETCKHHWIIESPDGRSVLNGVCKKCGIEKQNFKAWVESWDSDIRKSEFNSYTPPDIREIKRVDF